MVNKLKELDDVLRDIKDRAEEAKECLDCETEPSVDATVCHALDLVEVVQYIYKYLCPTKNCTNLFCKSRDREILKILGGKS